MAAMNAKKMKSRRSAVWQQVHRLIQEEPDPAAIAAAREARFLQRQVETLQLYYHSAPWHADAAYTEAYAKKYTAQILKNGKEILAHWRQFLRDRALVSWLQENDPKLLDYASFSVRTLALASWRDVEPPPPPSPPTSPPSRRKLTPEERAAKIEEYRARMLERERVQAQDYMARVKQKIDLRNQFRADLEQSGLDPDEVQQLEQEFLEELFREEDHPNGTTSKEVI